MKNIILILLLIAFTQETGLAQTKDFTTLKTEYENLDIKNVSGSVLFMINEEMKRANPIQYNEFIQTKRDDIYKRFDLGKSVNQQTYLDKYNENLQTLRKQFLSNDVLMQVNPETIAYYGNDVLSKYQGNYASQYTTGFLQLVIKAKLTEYTNNKITEISDIVLSQKDKLNTLSIQIISYWKASNAKIASFQNDDSIIQEEVLKVVKQIPTSDTAFKNFLIHSSDALAKKVKTELNSGLSNSINVVTAKKEEYKNKFTTLYRSYATEVKTETEKNFKKLGKAIDSLSKNEEVVYQTLSSIQNKWNATQDQINTLETRMRGLANDPAQLSTVVSQHAQLLAENFLRLDIINQYVNKGVEVYNTISFVKSEVYDRIADPAKRVEFINSLSLDNLSLPTLSDAFASVAGFASQVKKVFPNCKPIEEIATVANYLMAAVNIGVGVAELCSYNPMGLISIFSGLSSVFGGKPEPSPEMKMMQQMMSYMQDQFKHINAHLEYIEQQLGNLTTIVQDMYRDMMQSFAVIGDKLDRIDRKIEVLGRRTNLILYAKYNQCNTFTQCYEEIQNNSERNIPQFFSDYTILNNCGDSKTCLSALRTYSITENKYFNTVEANAQNLSLSDIEVNGIYNPTVHLFQLLNTDDITDALNSLNLPPKQISNSGDVYYNIVQEKKLKVKYTPNEVFNSYYDYKMLEKMVSFLISYAGYFEIADQNFDPLPLETYLTEDENNKIGRYSTLRIRLENLLTLVNYSIMQQSILAGNTMIDYTYNYLLGACKDCNSEKDKKIIDTAISVLDSNKLFAKNFASMLVYSSINRSIDNDARRAKRFSDLYFSTDNQRLEMLNKEFYIPMVSFEADNTNNLILRIKGRGREFTIPVPPPSFIISNEMAQSDGLYTLLSTKQKLLDKLTDLSFFKKFEPVKGLTMDDYKYLIQN